jgi:hypothetical protein
VAEITSFTRLRISLQCFAQFATGRIRRGGHDKTMNIGAPDLKFPVNTMLACDLNIGASNFFGYWSLGFGISG